ncbi:hypothetical protein DPX16_17313 [Anabarilius grahami]|uniref:Uncharacterized protein n=1 Tax=Anabarilius grahami TaxID=495550 RepID=A0A3N0YBA4_ANAGA|nr:hypothetical protein DPX16_17313 [Anabarilius grahami]
MAKQSLQTSSNKCCERLNLGSLTFSHILARNCSDVQTSGKRQAGVLILANGLASGEKEKDEDLRLGLFPFSRAQLNPCFKWIIEPLPSISSLVHTLHTWLLSRCVTEQSLHHFRGQIDSLGRNSAECCLMLGAVKVVPNDGITALVDIPDCCGKSEGWQFCMQILSSRGEVDDSAPDGHSYSDPDTLYILPIGSSNTMRDPQ